jgi:endo-1,4-beta-xylanase
VCPVTPAPSSSRSYPRCVLHLLTSSSAYYSQCIPGGPVVSTPAAPTTTPTTIPTTTLVTSTTPVATPTTTAPGTGTGSSGPVGTSTGGSKSINQLFVAKGKRYFGVATDQGRLTTGSNAAIIQADFGQVTPENSMKWDTTEGPSGLPKGLTELTRS